MVNLLWFCFIFLLIGERQAGAAAGSVSAASLSPGSDFRSMQVKPAGPQNAAEDFAAEQAEAVDLNDHALPNSKSSALLAHAMPRWSRNNKATTAVVGALALLLLLGAALKFSLGKVSISPSISG